MRQAVLIISLFLSTIPQAWADLAEYAMRDSRLSVFPILKPYDQIQGYQAQAMKWDKNFKEQYGSNWRIVVDVRDKRGQVLYLVFIILI